MTNRVAAPTLRPSADPQLAAFELRIRTAGEAKARLEHLCRLVGGAS